MIKLLTIFFLFFCTNLFSQEKQKKEPAKSISVSKLIEDSLRVEKINGIDCFSGIYFSQIIYNEVQKTIEIKDSIPKLLKTEIELVLTQNRQMLNLKLLKRKEKKIIQPFMIHLTGMCNIPESIVPITDTSISPVVMYRQLSMMQANTIHELKESFIRGTKTSWKENEDVILLVPCLIEYKEKFRRRDNN
jgi:hypothetical protein